MESAPIAARRNDLLGIIGENAMWFDSPVQVSGRGGVG
jgi:hypothetical protein